MAITTYPLNGIEYDAHDAETYLCTRTSGVFSSDDNFAISITGARQVTISPGLAWINNGDFRGKSVVNTAPENITIPTADGTLNRIDLIVLRFDAAANKTVFAVKSGEPAMSPTPPKVSREAELYEIGLYIVSVTAGSVSVISSDITSVMLDEAYCGVMRDGVTGIPTAQIQQQAESLIEELRNQMGNIITANVDITDNGGDPQINVKLVKDDQNNISLNFDFQNTIPNKQEVIDGVIEALPTWTGGSY